MCDTVSSLRLGVDPGTVGASLRDDGVRQRETLPLVRWCIAEPSLSWARISCSFSKVPICFVSFFLVATVPFL